MTGFIAFVRAGLLVSAVLALSLSPSMADGNDGVVRIKSAVSIPEAVARIKKDIAAKAKG